MKKTLILLVLVGMNLFSSCTGPEGPPGFDGEDGAIPLAFEIKKVNLARVVDNEYKFSGNFDAYIDGDLFDDETVLIYRLTDLIDNNTRVWQLIPRTIYFNNGDVIDYFFDFSKVDFVITTVASFNLAEEPYYINNQTFRVVIIPSTFAKSFDKNNYKEVMNSLKINESQIQKIDL